MNRLLQFLRTLRLPALILACSSCGSSAKISVGDRIKLEESAATLACQECAKEPKCPLDAVAFCARLNGDCSAVEDGARGSVAAETDGGAQ